MMNEPEFDKYAVQYDNLLSNSIPVSLDDGAYFAEYKIALIENLLKPNQPNRILDFGCGAGRSLPYLAKRFPDAKLFGYDVSPFSLEQAAKSVPGVNLFSNWEDVGSDSFDLIIAANVFHHIPLSERKKALIQCRDVLAIDGSMFLFEHNPFNPATRWIFERCPFDKDAEMLSLREAKQMLTSAGFKLEKRGYTLFFPRPLAFLRPLEPFLKHIPLGAQYYVQMEK